MIFTENFYGLSQLKYSTMKIVVGFPIKYASNFDIHLKIPVH